MHRLTALVLTAGVLSVSGSLVAQGRTREHGRATVEFRSPEVIAVAVYEYSQRHHDGAWLLIEFGVRATKRVAIHRDEISLMGPDERRVPLATQQQFLDDHQVLNQLLQNARIWRRSLDSYFVTPRQQTTRFFSVPGGLVHDSAVSNLDEVAAGDLFFKAPDGRWPAGSYRLILQNAGARAELPLTLN